MALLRLRGVYSPTHYYVRVSQAEIFTGTGPSSQTLGLSSWVELLEVLMFQAFWIGIPSCVSRRAAPGLEMPTILNEPSHMGESLCSPSLESTRL